MSLEPHARGESEAPKVGSRCVRETVAVAVSYKARRHGARDRGAVSGPEAESRMLAQGEGAFIAK